jgi:tetratricopeptide (TPR) repeat protein/transcriptional regulator with XRE-family HTH domain
MSEEEWPRLLRLLRMQRGLSQERVAELSGVSVRAISDIERGKTQWPRLDTMERLTRALSLPDEERDDIIAAALGLIPEVPAGPDPESPGEVVPRQLPASAPGFVGRHEQLTALSFLLDISTEVHARGGAGAVAVIDGTAGVGKTSLAVHWAHLTAQYFPDGQIFVDLLGFGPSTTPLAPSEVVQMLLHALGVPPERRPATTEAQLGLYRSLLMGKRMLLVLDNARDADQVRPLLPSSPTCRTIVTSRTRLTGLVALDGAMSLTLGVMSVDEARDVLKSRLGGDRIAAEPDAVAQIIKRCARLPLALCVAAARAALRPETPLTSVAADLATHRRLAALAVHGDMLADVRATFSWSYRNLSHGAQRLFRLLGLHPGVDISAPAAAGLVSMPEDQARLLLDELTHCHLLREHLPGRYTFHDLLRAYATELAASYDSPAEQRTAVLGLLDYYVQNAAAVMDVAFPGRHHQWPRGTAPLRPGPGVANPAAARAWLDTERANMVAAIVSLGDNWPLQATSLAASLFDYLDVSGHLQDAIIVYRSALRAAQTAQDPACEAMMLTCRGLTDRREGRMIDATDRLERAHKLFRQVGDRLGEAHALAGLGLLDVQSARFQQAVDHLRPALRLLQEIGEQFLEARVLGNLGSAERWRGNYTQSRIYLLRSLDLCRTLGDRDGEADAHTRIGRMEVVQEHYFEAVVRAQQALALCREVGDLLGEGDALLLLGEAYLHQGLHREAAASYRQVIDLARQVGDRVNEAEARCGIATIDLREGRHQAALDGIGQAMALSRESSNRLRETDAFNCLGNVSLAMEQPDRSAEYFGAALDLAEQTGDHVGRAHAHHGIARAHEAAGEPARADRHWREALTLYATVGSPKANEIRTRLFTHGTSPKAPER